MKLWHVASCGGCSKDHDWVEIVGEASNIEEALTLTHEFIPSLLFLDIQMPGGSGSTCCRAWTSHRRLSSRRLTISTRYAHSRSVRWTICSSPSTRSGWRLPWPSWAHVILSERQMCSNGCSFAMAPAAGSSHLREVRLISAEGNYLRLSWGTLQPLLARPLTVLEQRLDPALFFRANRSQIINLDFIEAVEVGVGGRLHVQLRGGPEVEISRRQAQLFRRRTISSELLLRRSNRSRFMTLSTRLRTHVRTVPVRPSFRRLRPGTEDCELDPKMRSARVAVHLTWPLLRSRPS